MRLGFFAQMFLGIFFMKIFLGILTIFFECLGWILSEVVFPLVRWMAATLWSLLVWTWRTLIVQPVAWLWGLAFGYRPSKPSTPVYSAWNRRRGLW